METELKCSTCLKGDHSSAHTPLPLCLSVQWPQFKADLMSCSRDVCSYHTAQMSEWMPAGSALWWELVVMRGGTRCERRLPKGRQINYSAWSFASTRLRWQHMRGIHLCNIHRRTSRRLAAARWVRGAHTYVPRRIRARDGGAANCLSCCWHLCIQEMQVMEKTTERCLLDCFCPYCWLDLLFFRYS